MADAAAAEARGFPVEKVEGSGQRCQPEGGVLLGGVSLLIGHPSIVRLSCGSGVDPGVASRPCGVSFAVDRSVEAKEQR